MRRDTVTLSADTASTLIGVCYPPRNGDTYKASIHIQGTFGSGTLTLFTSADGGTTKLAMRDYSRTAYSLTAAEQIDVEFGVGNTAETSIRMYATLTGSTNPDIDIIIHDNF